MEEHKCKSCGRIGCYERKPLTEKNKNHIKRCITCNERSFKYDKCKICRYIERREKEVLEFNEKKKKIIKSKEEKGEEFWRNE